jgi:hypothetical protein
MNMNNLFLRNLTIILLLGMTTLFASSCDSDYTVIEREIVISDYNGFIAVKNGNVNEIISQLKEYDEIVGIETKGFQVYYSTEGNWSLIKFIEAMDFSYTHDLVSFLSATQRNRTQTSVGFFISRESSQKSYHLRTSNSTTSVDVLVGRFEDGTDFELHLPCSFFTFKGKVSVIESEETTESIMQVLDQEFPELSFLTESTLDSLESFDKIEISGSAGSGVN